MIWATWRMERTLLVVTLGTVAVLAVLLVVAGARQETAWSALSGLHCNQPGSSTACMGAAERYYSSSRFSSAGVAAGVVLPGLLGLVLGAPLVAGEIAQRTNRLAWTQSITRTRWLVAKLGVGTLATVAIMAALMPMFQWWTGAVQRGDRILPANFDVSGLVPVAYGLFAFMLGALLGSTIRRTGWSFAVGVVLFAAFRYLVRTYLRSGLISPVTTPVAPVAPSSSWVINEGYVPVGLSSPAAGTTWQSGSEVIDACTNRGGGDNKALHSVQQCQAVNHLHFVVQIQPGGHYWALQAAEAAVFAGAAMVLFALTLFVVRRWGA